MNTTSIAVLFARDPLQHTDADIDAIIEHFRANRRTFQETGKAPRGGKQTAAQAEAARVIGDIDIGDL